MVEKAAVSCHPSCSKGESTWDTDFGNHASLVVVITELFISQLSSTQIRIYIFHFEQCREKARAPRNACVCCAWLYAHTIVNTDKLYIQL